MTERPAQPRPELMPLPDGVASGRVEVRRYRPGDGSAFFAALTPQREELMQWMMWPQKHQRPEDSESYVVRMHALVTPATPRARTSCAAPAWPKRV